MVRETVGGTIDDGKLMRLAARHLRNGDLTDAARLCAQVLEHRPEHAEARHLMGLAAWREGRPEVAAEQILRALRVEPRNVLYHTNMAGVLAAMGQPGDSLRAYRTALRLQPDSAHLYFGAGTQLLALGDAAAAAEAFTEALRLEPRHTGALSNLATARLRQGRLDAAVEQAEAALAIDGGQAAPRLTLAAVHTARGALGRARAQLDESLARVPAYGEAHLERARLSLHLGRPGEAVADAVRFLEMGPRDARLASQALTVLRYDPEPDPQRWQRAHGLWHRLHAASRLAGGAAPAAVRAVPRVGWILPDIRLADVRHRLRPLIEALADTGLPQYVYAPSVPAAAPAGDSGPHWRDVSGLAEAGLTERLREDDLDVLVDAFGHDSARYGAGVVPVLANRPARRVVAWGLADPDVTPGLYDAVLGAGAGEDESGEDARAPMPSARLWVGSGGVARDPQAPAPTLACWAEPAAISDRLLSAWADLLARAPEARLLLCHEAWRADEAVTEVTARAEALGVPAARLACRAQGPLSMLSAADVVLDSHPVSQGATLGRALMVGVPVVTWDGARPVSRTGAEALRAAGCDDWVADDAAGYVARAANLASAPPDRGALAARIAASGLADARGPARELGERLRALGR